MLQTNQIRIVREWAVVAAVILQHSWDSWGSSVPFGMSKICAALPGGRMKADALLRGVPEDEDEEDDEEKRGEDEDEEVDDEGEGYSE